MEGGRLKEKTDRGVPRGYRTESKREGLVAGTMTVRSIGKAGKHGNKIAMFFFLGLVPFLSSCRVDMEVKLDWSGGGTIASTVTTDSENVYQLLRAAAEKERAKGMRVETGALGPSRFVRVQERFARIEELNVKDSALIWSVQKDDRGGLRLNVRAANAGTFALIPLTIAVHMPGPILDATAGVNINGNTASWQGVYASLGGRGISIESKTSYFALPPPLLVILFLVAGLAAGAYFYMRRPSLPRPSRFCENCGIPQLSGARYCQECGARVK